MTSELSPEQSPPATTTFWCCSCEREYDAVRPGTICQDCWDLEPQWQDLRSAPVGQTFRHAPGAGSKNYTDVTRNYTDVIVTPGGYDCSVDEHVFGQNADWAANGDLKDGVILPACHPWLWVGRVAARMLELADRAEDHELGASLVSLLAPTGGAGHQRILRWQVAFTPDALDRFEGNHPHVDLNNVRLAAAVALMHTDAAHCRCAVCRLVVGDFGAATRCFGPPSSRSWAVQVATQWMVAATGGSKDAELFALAAQTAAELEAVTPYGDNVLTLDAVARASCTTGWGFDEDGHLRTLAVGLLDHRHATPHCLCVLCRPYLSPTVEQ